MKPYILLKYWYRYLTMEISKLLKETFDENRMRLSDIKYSKELGYEICIVQIIGKSIFPEVEAKYLVNHPEILREFSTEDVVKITRLNEKIKNELDNRKCRIRELFPESNKKKRDLVILEETGKSSSRVVRINEICQDHDLLYRIEPLDLFVLGTKKGALSILCENEELNKEKFNKKRSFLKEFFQPKISKKIKQN